MRSQDQDSQGSLALLISLPDVLGVLSCPLSGCHDWGRAHAGLVMRRASSQECPVQSAGEGQMAVNALQVRAEMASHTLLGKYASATPAPSFYSLQHICPIASI